MGTTKTSTILIILLILLPNTSYAIPFSEIESLASITFWERTGGTAPNPYTFALDSQQLLNQLRGTLSYANNDFMGANTEYYDIFYSDAYGTFAADGEYLTIEGTWGYQLPKGGALNIAEMGLNFADGTTEYGNYVGSYLALGDNAHPEFVGNAIDGNFLTHTTMGNTVVQTERLRHTGGSSC